MNFKSIKNAFTFKKDSSEKSGKIRRFAWDLLRRNRPSLNETEINIIADNLITRANVALDEDLFEIKSNIKFRRTSSIPVRVKKGLDTRTTNYSEKLNNLKNNSISDAANCKDNCRRKRNHNYKENVNSNESINSECPDDVLLGAPSSKKSRLSNKYSDEKMPPVFRRLSSIKSKKDKFDEKPKKAKRMHNYDELPPVFQRLYNNETRGRKCTTNKICQSHQTGKTLNTLQYFLKAEDEVAGLKDDIEELEKALNTLKVRLNRA